MKSPWKITALIACIAMSVGAVIAWQVYKHRNNERKLKEAAQACRARAEKGDAIAQARLAYMYLHGQGVQRDYDKAALWYRKSADLGNPRGETGIGYMYYVGDGVLQDFAEAARWNRKAADQGYPHAEVNLGDMYYDGYGLPQDYTEAARWYRKAADQGDARARYYLGYMYSYGKGLPRDRSVADWWYHKAAANGDETAQRVLGLRGSGLSTCWKIFIATDSLACFLLFGAYFRPLHREFKTRDSHALVGAILQLILLALVLFGSFHGIPRDPPYILIMFHSIFAIVLGMSLTTVMCLLWRRGARWMLTISCVWFVTSNLIVLGICLHLVGHTVTFYTLASTPSFYGIEATPIGMALSAAILLWISSKPAKGSNALDTGFEGPEPFAGNGIGE